MTRLLWLVPLLAGCNAGALGDGGALAWDGAVAPPAPVCEAAGGGAVVAAPRLKETLADPWAEGWLASPAVADLDGDGVVELIGARDNGVVVWARTGGAWRERWRFDELPGRIWASPVVADLTDAPGLEVAVASRDQVIALSQDGALLPGFPVSWEDELRSLAAGDVDGDGRLELLAATTAGRPDVINAWHGDGRAVAGFPPNATGASGCDEACYLAGAYDQNLGIGDLDGEAGLDVVVPHDNAYVSVHHGTGEAFDVDPRFEDKTKSPGVRYLHDWDQALQGWAEDEDRALQAHFTNTAPALVDLDGDGRRDVVLLGSVQNAAQTERTLGVALWAVRPDGTRLPGFEIPIHFPDYLAGLWDFEDTNLVAATNQVSAADVFPDKPGPELFFAGFDGQLHAVSAQGERLWSARYTASPNELTGGVVVGDLSGDGVPELALTTYSTQVGQGALLVYDAGGAALHRVPLPGRGSMAVPTLGDVDGDGRLEIAVSLKDGAEEGAGLLVFAVDSAQTNCLLWPTGRGNLQRTGAL